MTCKESFEKLKHVLYLSWSLAKVKFRLRNESSILGIFWYLMEPLLTFAILLLFGRAFYQDKIPYYPLYLLTGLIVFNFFLAVTSLSIKAITSNACFVKNMKIATEPFVIAGLFQFLLSHIFEIILLLLLAIYLKAPLSGFFVYPLFIFFFSLFVLGCSFLFATMGVFVNDFLNIWHVLGRLLWFSTPIFYSVQKGSALHTLNKLNPLNYFVSAARDLLVYCRMPSLDTILFIFISSLLLFFCGGFVFTAKKKFFASKL